MASGLLAVGVFAFGQSRPVALGAEGGGTVLFGQSEAADHPGSFSSVRWGGFALIPVGGLDVKASVSLASDQLDDADGVLGVSAYSRLGFGAGVGVEVTAMTWGALSLRWGINATALRFGDYDQGIATHILGLTRFGVSIPAILDFQLEGWGLRLSQTVASVYADWNDTKSGAHWSRTSYEGLIGITPVSWGVYVLL